MTVAIIGYGDFGKLLARLLPDGYATVVVDPRQDAGNSNKPVRFVTLEEAAKADIVFIATPFDAIESVCEVLSRQVRPETIVADLCSVKIKPAEILMRYFDGKCRFVATHPLFGPNSVPDLERAKGQQLVWSELPGGGDVSSLRALFTDHLGLTIIEMSPDDHDREMAWIHALTFFVGRTLSNMHIPELRLSTGYFGELLDLVRLDTAQSEALYQTVELYNPYARTMRTHYLGIADETNRDLDK